MSGKITNGVVLPPEAKKAEEGGGEGNASTTGADREPDKTKELSPGPKVEKLAGGPNRDARNTYSPARYEIPASNGRKMTREDR